MTLIAIDLGQIITAEARAAQALADAKAAARATLLAQVEAARRPLVTALPGQEMIYLAKEAEARRWIADPVPDPADYPLLSAEIGITAPDAHSLAQLWLNMAALMISEGARLEALRLSTGAAIDAAETVEAVQEATHGL